MSKQAALPLFGDPKFVPKDFQITHKPEQKQRSYRGLPRFNSVTFT